MSTAFEALLATARKAKPRFLPLGEKESDLDYLSRLAQAVSSSSKEEFDNMPQAAQTWFDETADALSEGKEVPLPEGYDRTNLLKEEPPVAKSTTTPQVQAAGDKAIPVSVRIRELVIANENATVDALIEQLKPDIDMTTRRTTVATIRYDALMTIRLMKEAGWVKA